MSDFESRINALTPGQRALLSRRLEEAGAKTIEATAFTHRQSLVAYVAAKQRTPSVDELRRYLLDHLPDYMVPPTFVFLDTLPLTSSGKVDKDKLPKAERGSRLQQSAAAPQSDAESVLGAIWAEILGFDEVGPDDNFFEMGGDSLLSIRILARARQAGIVVTPKQFFDTPTVSGMAASAASSLPTSDEEDEKDGDIPLTPIQHWFFEQDFPDRHHWNQEVAVEIPSELNDEILERALGCLVKHHDALRLGFSFAASDWRQRVVEKPQRFALHITNLARLPETERGQVIRNETSKLHQSFDLGEGLLFRAALFRIDGAASRLHLIAHHLAVDGLSWSILLENLYSVCKRLRDGRDAGLSKTTSFKLWATRLKDFAQSNELIEQSDHWLSLERFRGSEMPVDFPEGRTSSRVDASESVSVALSADETPALFQQVARAYHMQVNELVITALAQSLLRFAKRSTILLDLEGHGREDILGLDTSQTVGWFTTVFTVGLELDHDTPPKEALETVKEQLRAVPHGGIGLGLLRYLHDDPDLCERFRTLPRSDVVFNYLGELRDDRARSFARLRGATGAARSTRGRRPYLVEINARIDNGSFEAVWSFSGDVFRKQTIRRLADDFQKTLRAFVAHARSPEAGGHTPSDFPLADLKQQELDQIAHLLDDEGE